EAFRDARIGLRRPQTGIRAIERSRRALIATRSELCENAAPDQLLRDQFPNDRSEWLDAYVRGRLALIARWFRAAQGVADGVTREIQIMRNSANGLALSVQGANSGPNLHWDHLPSPRPRVGVRAWISSEV